MTYRPQPISDYSFDPADELFLDANVWLFVHGPQRPNDKRVKIYSEALKEILDAKCRVYIDVLIMSEFINRYARLRFSQSSQQGIDYKEFRQSRDFQSVAQEIAAVLRIILKHCSRIDSGFVSLNLEDLISQYSRGDFDFNDQVITALCQSRGLKLITHDADFRGQGITILTANQKLLS